MVRRRRVLATVGVLAGLSGCEATQEEFEFESEPGAFSEDATDDAGYEELEQERIVEERVVEVGGEDRDVTVINYAQPYRREVSVGGDERTLAAAAVFTTPSISFVGQQYNPIADESPRELLDRARGRIEDQIDGGEIRDISKESERSASILDTDTTISVFEAVTELDGAELTLRIHLTKLKHEGDFILLAGGFPKQLSDDERPRLETLLNNVEHDGDQ